MGALQEEPIAAAEIDVDAAAELVGGVFDVGDHLAEDGKAYVPIDAKLRVDQPAAFALTLEKPGGVVKSNNALLVVAALP